MCHSFCGQALGGILGEIYIRERNDQRSVKSHLGFCLTPGNLIGERHKFNTRRQNSGESVDHYITDLKTLAASCEYGSLVSDLVTSQLVAGISIW